MSVIYFSDIDKIQILQGSIKSYHQSSGYIGPQRKFIGWLTYEKYAEA